MRKKLFLGLVGTICLCGMVFFSTILTPQKFVKLASLRASQDVQEYLDLSLGNTLNPEATVQNIPYERGRFVDVLPKRRYERSIVQGKGDCSNLANGLAYALIKQDIDFSVLHLLQLPGFTEGKGHVALEVALEVDGVRQSAILDLLEGGVLSDGRQIISSDDLISGDHDPIAVIPYHRTRDERSAYYEAKNLETTVLGFTPNEEMENYFNFIGTIYIDIGHRAVERYLFDSVALLLGIFPKIYIPADDMISIDEEHYRARFISKLFLWMLRALCVLIIMFVLNVLLARINKVRVR